MSSPSTPRSTRSASPTGGSPDILTPGRKVKAMLAQFESDSESDNENQSKAPRPTTKPSTSDVTSSHERARSAGSEDDEDEDEDEDIVMPKGRMAARMQAETHDGGSNIPKTNGSAFERVSKALGAQKEVHNDGAQNQKETGKDHDDAMASSDDDLPAAAPRRNPAKGKKRSDPDEESDGSRSRSLSRERSFSPLFMSSPAKQRDAPSDHDDSDASAADDKPNPKDNSRLQALVAQKRKEREERERIEADKKAARTAQNEKFNSDVLSGEGSADDGANGSTSGRKLTQQSRPSRKASKKALEEMHRETQRMSRNMQLAHQAQTKKKITKESFLARFNFGQSNVQNAPASSSTAGSQNSSDAEAQKGRETPGTSPVLEPTDKTLKKTSTNGQQKPAEPELATAIPNIEEVMAGAHLQNKEPVVARAEVQANGSHTKMPAPLPESEALKKPPVRVQLSRQSVAQNQEDDSDSDLEVVTEPAKSRKLEAFENLPAKQLEESRSMLKLKALANLTSPSRSQSSMDFGQLSANLLAKARQQTARERQEKIEELRAKGIVIETNDERAAMEDQIENIVEKARKEADDIAKMERKSSKKHGQDDNDDDEDDDDFVLSGSEDEEGYGAGDDEENDDEGEEEDDQEKSKEEGLIDSEAGEYEGSGDEKMDADEDDAPRTRRKRPTRVVSDDEDDEEPQRIIQENPTTPNKNASQHMEFPGMAGPSSMTMGLTQAFAGTLGASQQDSQQKSPAVFPTLPDPDNAAQLDSPSVIKDSQEQRTGTDIFAGFAPSEAGGPESPAAREMSMFSQLPDPTQDAGFVLSPFDPAKRFMDPPQSTEETVLLRRSTESPAPQRKGKHLRRGRAEEDATGEKDESNFEVDASAFDVMKKGHKKPSDPFDKKKSKAKDIVEEAADESEDEYAGLGGASDDSDDEEDAYDSTMINDNSGEKVDGKQLAALNASHQRDADEKQVAQLLKDITTGALRRGRGGDDELDLDDPEDELLARRRAKQREFARMRNALLADGKVTEIAENPKKAAFFKAIEDRDEDDVELDFLEYDKEEASQGTSQDVESEKQQKQTSTDAEDNDSNKRKRPLEPSADDISNRPPPHMRRTPASAMSKKPASLAEIRETVSFLTECHEYDSFHEDAAIEQDEDHGERMNEDETEIPTNEPQEDFIPRAHQHPRRTRNPNRVVDRLALRRQASSNSATSASASARFAFHAGAGKDPAAGIGFRPPPLSRKATTGSISSGSGSSSSVSSDSRKTSKAMATGGASGTKKGAVNYYTAAREREREREIRVKERSSGSNVKALLEKHASNRLGALGKGQFE